MNSRNARQTEVVSPTILVPLVFRCERPARESRGRDERQAQTCAGFAEHPARSVQGPLVWHTARLREIARPKSGVPRLSGSLVSCDSVMALLVYIGLTFRSPTRTPTCHSHRITPAECASLRAKRSAGFREPAALPLPSSPLRGSLSPRMCKRKCLRSITALEHPVFIF